MPLGYYTTLRLAGRFWCNVEKAFGMHTEEEAAVIIDDFNTTISVMEAGNDEASGKVLLDTFPEAAGLFSKVKTGLIIAAVLIGLFLIYKFAYLFKK